MQWKYKSVKYILKDSKTLQFLFKGTAKECKRFLKFKYNVTKEFLDHSGWKQTARDHNIIITTNL